MYVTERPLYFNRDDENTRVDVDKIKIIDIIVFYEYKNTKRIMISHDRYLYILEPENEARKLSQYFTNV